MGLKDQFIENTNISPSASCSVEQGIIDIKGKALFLDVIDAENNLLFPILEWINKYFESGRNKIIINFNLFALNTIGSLAFLIFFKELEYLKEPNNFVEINWYYNESNEEDILQAGEDYSELIKLPFKLLKTD